MSTLAKIQTIFDKADCIHDMPEINQALDQMAMKIPDK